MPNLHVVVPDFAPEGWRWIEPANSDRDWTWRFYRDPKTACGTAVKESRLTADSILLSHGFADARTCAMRRASYGYGRPFCVAFSFHAPFKFGIRDRFVFRRLAPHLDLLVVHSQFEREFYGEELDVPLAKIEVVPWYYEEAEITEPPRVEGDYLCAVGATMRDYGTLFRAMRMLPALRLVVVVRPENLEGLEVPENVTVLQNVPKAELWNIQYHSRIHVLPLTRTSRAGHACLTQAMYFGRPTIVGNVPCMTDYVEDGKSAQFYRPQDAEHLADVIRTLWEDDAALDALGASGKRHALQHYSQRSMGDYVESLITRFV